MASPPLPHPRITDVRVASNGDTWFSSRAGVARLDSHGQWETFAAQNSGLTSDIVLAIAGDQNGTILFVTANGVSAYEPGNAIDHPPDVTNPGSQANVEGDTVNLTIAVSDQDGEALAYNAGGLPAALSIGATTGVIGDRLPPVRPETSPRRSR
jgi:ligand-binding sensor domain-containing protein